MENSGSSSQAIPYSGQLVFTQGGTLSVQAMNPDANAADTLYTTKAYEAYYGPVEIDYTLNIFAITLESSLVRNRSMPRKAGASATTASENSSAADVLQEPSCLID